MIKSRQLLGRMINRNDFIFLPEGKEYQNESVKSSLCSIMLTKIILQPGEIVQVLVIAEKVADGQRYAQPM